MKAFRAIIIVACLYGAGYGYWGAFTSSGNLEYEGMSALLPFYVMLASISMLAIMGLYYLIIFVIKQRKS